MSKQIKEFGTIGWDYKNSKEIKENWEKEFEKREAVAISIFASNKTMGDCVQFAKNRAKTEKEILEKELQKAIENYAKEVIPLKNKKWRERVLKAKIEGIEMVRLEKIDICLDLISDKKDKTQAKAIRDGYNSAVEKLNSLKTSLIKKLK